MSKYEKFIRDIDSKKRTMYCASIHDENSLKNNYYDRESAEENFNFFIQNYN